MPTQAVSCLSYASFVHIHISYFVLFLTALPSTTRYQKGRYIGGWVAYIYIHIFTYTYVCIYYMFKNMYSHLYKQSFLNIIHFVGYTKWPCFFAFLVTEGPFIPFREHRRYWLRQETQLLGFIQWLRRSRRIF